jgi:sorting nexin-25
MPTKEIQIVADEIIGMVIKDFLESWFKFVSNDPTFTKRVETLFHTVIGNLVYRIEKVDFTQFILSRLFPIITNHIRYFKQAENLVRGSSKKYAPTDLISDELQLAKHYHSGKIHPAVNTISESTKDQELEYLRDIIKKALLLILPKAEASSRLASTILRELLCCTVLYNVVFTFSDPDYCNLTFDSIIDSLSKEIQQDKSSDSNADETKLPSFENFILDIRECNSIEEALDIQENIIREIKAKKLKLGF